MVIVQLLNKRALNYYLCRVRRIMSKPKSRDIGIPTRVVSTYQTYSLVHFFFNSVKVFIFFF